MDGLAISASLVEVRRAAEGALIRAVHEPEPNLFVFRVFGAGEHAIAVTPRGADIHITQLAFRNPERPSGFVMQLRKHLRGARVTAIRQGGLERVVELSAVRSESGTRSVSRLLVELTGARGNLLLLSEEGVVLGSSRQDPRNPVGRTYEPLPGQPKVDPRAVSADVLAQILASDTPARALARGLEGVGRRTAEDLVARAAAIGSADDPLDVRRALDELVARAERPEPHVDAAQGLAVFYPLPPPAERAESFGHALDLAARSRGPADAPAERSARDRLSLALGRATRTAQALRSWLVAAEEADTLRRRADFLMLHAADIGRGTAAVEGFNLTDESPIAFALAPRLSGMENAQALYRKARKLDRGRPTVAARLRRIEADIVRLQAALRDLDEGRHVEPAFATRPSPARAGKAAAPTGPRRFDIGGFTVLVGRNAAQNDELMRDARADDLWLHARDVSGSHVVVRRDGRPEIPSEVIQGAALLAARYSKADKRGKVAVVCAEARHVRKPRRGAPGLAIVTNESTLTVTLPETT